MKFNWGTGIVIAIVSFMAFILYFVVMMSTTKSASHDLVTEEYYQQELNYQNEINAYNNAKEKSKTLLIKKTTKGISILFPKNLELQNIKGTVSFYRPSNKKLDFDVEISLTDPLLLIPDTKLLDGRWDIKVWWQYQGKPYLQKEKITWNP